MNNIRFHCTELLNKPVRPLLKAALLIILAIEQMRKCSALVSASQSLSCFPWLLPPAALQFGFTLVVSIISRHSRQMFSVKQLLQTTGSRLNAEQTASEELVNMVERLDAKDADIFPSGQWKPKPDQQEAALFL